METKTRGRKREIGAVRRRKVFDARTDRRSATPTRDYIPSRLPGESAEIAKDLIVSVAYGYGGWSLAKLVERGPSRESLSLDDCERLNAVRRALEAQGYTYELLREMLIARQD